ncbi:hypothetical protein [Variovorax sp.]|uniref:hypothetical protein n=1 Tax=Variovorax sp. TaxID=1871043 RepID=UPI003BACE00E
MTTPTFSRLVGPTARAMAAVRNTHCQPPTFRPAATTRGTIRCTHCGGNITFTASAIDGRTTGRCSSADCICWNE